MKFESVTRVSATEAVFSQLIKQVTSGELDPGESLPNERELAANLGVSRPVLREALGRLEQTGLIAIKQGGGTKIADYLNEAGPEVLPYLLVRNGRVQFEVLSSIFEVREEIGIQLAGLAARKSSPSTQSALSEALKNLAAAKTDYDRAWASLAYWTEVVNQADSIAFRLLFNGLKKAYLPVIEIMIPVLNTEASQQAEFESLTQAILSNDATQARTIAAKILTVGSKAVAELIAKTTEETP